MRWEHAVAADREDGSEFDWTLEIPLNKRYIDDFGVSPPVGFYSLLFRSGL